MTTTCPGPLITQEELDTLSASLAVARAQRRQHADTATAALYDFRHPARLSPDEVRVLRGRVVSLASVLSRALSLYLGHGVDFRVHSIDLASYEQYVRNLAARPVVGLVSFGAGMSTALWEVSVDLARAAVDCMLGGSGMPGESRGGELGPLSRAVLGRLMLEVLTCWTELWPQLGLLGPRFEGIAHTAPADAGANEERLLHAVLEAAIGESRGILRLCLPLTVVRRLLREEAEAGAGGRAAPAAEEGSEAAPAAPLAATPLPVTVCLEAPEATLGSLLGIAAGEVMDLRVPAATPFTLCLSGVPKYEAEAGASGGRVAVRVRASLPDPAGA